MKKTILFINGHLDAGGCERSLIDVLKNIDYEKYEVDLLLLEHAGDFSPEIPKEVKVILCSIDSAFGRFVPCIVKAIKQRDWFSFFFRIYYTLGDKINRYFLKKLKKLFGKLKSDYDVIIAYRPGICTELAAFTFQGKKKISWWHHGCMNFSGKDADILGMSYQRMDTIVAVSSSSASLIAESFPDIKDKIKIIPNMIVPEELYIKSRKFEPKEFQKADFKIVSVGRLSPEKNMILCPRVAHLLKQEGINFKWILIGDGTEEQEIKKTIYQLGLHNEVLMIGKKNNPYPYIAMADVMVHPSLVESQGITLLESMVLKTPIIAVASQGPKEFIKTGRNGYLVNNNAKEIACIICKFYVDINLRMLIAKDASKAVQRFGNEEIMKKIQGILE